MYSLSSMVVQVVLMSLLLKMKKLQTSWIVDSYIPITLLNSED